MPNPFLPTLKRAWLPLLLQTCANSSQVCAKVGKIVARLRRHLRRWGGRTCVSAKNSSGRRPCGCQGNKKQPRLRVSLSLAVISCSRYLYECAFVCICGDFALRKKSRQDGEAARVRDAETESEAGGNRNKLQRWPIFWNPASSSAAQMFLQSPCSWNPGPWNPATTTERVEGGCFNCPRADQPVMHQRRRCLCLLLQSLMCFCVFWGAVHWFRPCQHAHATACFMKGAVFTCQ